MNEEKIQVHICGSGGWGIGSYQYIDPATGQPEVGYGFYRTKNPHDFFPDRECCSEKEIACHKKACEEWDAAQSVPDNAEEEK
jgi:hypothetical protein